MAISEQNQNLLFKAGLVAAGYFLVVAPLLEAIGVKQSRDEIERQKDIDKATGTGGAGNPWNKDYWRAKPGPVIDNNTALGYAQTIYDSFGLFGDSEEQVISVFRRLQFKKDVSRIADVFNQAFGGDLLAFLKVGSQYSGPWGGLSEADLGTIINIVNNLK
jgi:hypothetical protein